MPDEKPPVFVTPSNIPVVDWFFDLVGYIPIQQTKSGRRLGNPSKQDIFYSAKLIALDYSRDQYNGLLVMINEAKKEFR